MILRGKIRKFGSGGHFVAPKKYVGLDAVLVTDYDISRLEDMIYEVLALRKIKRIDDSEAMKKAQSLEAEFRARMDILEDRIRKLEDSKSNI